MLATYRNGNCLVTLDDDGTKTRTWDGDAVPEFPESIDLKITDRCDGGCAWCHEQSTTRGQHASVSDVASIVHGLPPGVEIAIGGGDPFSHPELESILLALADRGLIANVTVNGDHVARALDRLTKYRDARLIYGVGITYTEHGGTFCYQDPNTVMHVIAGIHPPSVALRLLADECKVLVLGYKTRGRGVRFHGSRVEKCLAAWRYWLPTILSHGLVSFDNLAIEQFNVRSMVPADAWAQHYMGDDGAFTMYVDAVRNEFAVSSTSEHRMPCEGRSAREMFAVIRHRGERP